MRHSRLPNLLGALGLALCDEIRARTAETLDLGGEAPAALVCVGTRPDRSIDDLRRALGISHSGAVRIVDRLQSRGLVRRGPASDARALQLRLTRRGEAAFRRVLDRRSSALDRALAPLSMGERRSLESLLDRLLAGLPQDRADAWRICRLCDHGVCRGDGCPVGSGIPDPPSGATA